VRVPPRDCCARELPVAPRVISAPRGWRRIAADDTQISMIVVDWTHIEHSINHDHGKVLPGMRRAASYAGELEARGARRLAAR
jgi:hypothetical protein